MLHACKPFALFLLIAKRTLTITALLRRYANAPAYAKTKKGRK
nr:MAG TPA: hypothetical protein [Caudoviricetes sp.]